MPLVEIIDLKFKGLEHAIASYLIRTMEGHAWVCDGYRSTTYCETGTTYLYLHMNWGWGGGSDTPNGWYAYNDWSPRIFNFKYNKGMIYNIKH